MAKEEFKKWYNHNKLFRHRSYTNETTLSKYVWTIKDSYNEMPVLKWSFVNSAPGYSNISKRCLVCFHEIFEIVNYTNQAELLNKLSLLISKCCHANKYLLPYYNNNYCRVISCKVFSTKKDHLYHNWKHET